MNANKTILNSFKEQVSLNEEAIAVFFEEGSLSYKELDLKSTLWAKCLIKLGVGHKSVVGLMTIRSLDMITAIFAVLKTGACYMPLDSDQPVSRINHMLKESGTEFIITNISDIAARFNKYSCINTEGLEGFDESKNKISLPRILNEDSAYCIFTSGSSGTPKGVLMRHSSVVNLVEGLKERVYQVYEGKTMRVALLASYVFDASVQQIFGALLQGHTLYITDDESRKNGAKLLSFYNKNKIDVSDGTPTHLRLLMDSSEEESKLNSLSSWILAGEVLPKDLVQLFFSRFGENTQLYNFYGPTETCVDSTSFKVNPKELEDYITIPIGKPLPNERAYVTDTHGNMLPIGIIGELCIAGEGLASKYIGDENLTRDKFSSDWIEGEERVYRTGDMARWLPDGNLEYHGRKDEQVKIRGHRIEPAEIEQQLNTHPKIEHSIVVNKELENEINLIAYYKSTDKLNISELRGHLAIHLPEYMIPHRYVHMEKFPLNVNGKIDRKALPEYKMYKDEEYIPPSNNTEEKLVKLYSEILELDINSIGLNSNFFDLGGNSLNFVFLKNKVEFFFNVSLSLTKLMSMKNIQELAVSISSDTQIDFLKIPKAKELDYYPLSSAQRRMYFLHKYNKESLVYNIPLVFTLHGILDREKVELAYQKLIQRHESLRTIFEFADGNPVQRILPKVNFSVTYLKKDTDLNSAINKFISPFNLSQAPLLRVGIMPVSDKEHLMIFETHHIVSDGITTTILLKDFISFYKKEELPELHIQYKDYIMWQLEEKQKNEIAQQKDFWLTKFSDKIPNLQLPYDHARPKERSNHGGNHKIELSKYQSKQLKELSRTEGVTMYSLILTIYNVLLSKLSNQEDIVVGTPVAGRQHIDLEGIPGIFVNTLAIRNLVKGTMTFKNFLQQVQESNSLALDNQLYPHEELIDSLKLERDTSRNALFDVFLNYVFEDDKIDLNRSGLRIEELNTLFPVAEFDLSLTTLDSKEKLSFIFNYNKNLFEVSSIERFVSYFRSIIDAVMRNVDFNLSALDILSSSEQKILLKTFNATATPYERDKSLVTLFEQQVKLYPNLKAVCFEEDFLTYKELNDKSNQVAHYLVSKGVVPGNIVGLLFERSLDMIVGIFGVLKAGGGYLPLDPDLPEQRIGSMLDQSSSVLLLSTKKYLEQYSAYLPIEVIYAADIKSKKTSNLNIELQSDDLAYCIFTSGSSGKPKGVMMNHRSVINLVKGLKENVYHAYKKNKIRVALLASFSFDASVQQIFGSLLQGHSLYIVDDESRKDGAKLRFFYNINTIDLSDGTPTHLRIFVNALDKGASLGSLSSWILAGEALSKELVEKFHTLIGEKVQLYNFYGPTETCVDSTSYKIDWNTLEDYTSIPIGKPLPNERVYITDPYGSLVPMGVIGELCIAGDGLAQRYIGNQSLTSDKFASDWIASEEKVYRTGDLVRWLPDGNLGYHGRIDDQVKIRGYRIELSEIIYHLNSHSEINHSIVIIKENKGEKYLLAYYEAADEQDITSIRLHLEQYLPSYMIPSYYIHIAQLPLTVNGKVDRNLLPDFKLKQEDDYKAPSTETEKKLVEIWSEILKVEEGFIGVYSNFFDLGGNSLNLVFLDNKLTEKFNVSLSLTKLILLKNIEQLSTAIDSSIRKEYFKILKAEEKAYYSLSSSQKRLFFLNEFDKKAMAYSQPQYFILKGIIDREKLTKVFQQMIARHESLRTSFELFKGDPIQRIMEETPFELEYFRSTLKESSAIISNFVRPFNLEKAPLFRVGLIRISKEKHIMMFDMHHIISDGISIGIFINDLMALYQEKKLPTLRVHYKDYAEWQQNKMQQKGLEKHKQFWNEQFSELPSVLELPTDYARPKIISYRGNTIEFKINSKQTKELSAIAKKLNTTLFSVILGIYNTLLYKVTSQEDIIVGISVAGRNHSDIENVMGVFLNSLPLRNKIKNKDSFHDFLLKINENSLLSFEHQDYPYEELINDLSLSRDTSRNPLFDVMFEYANFEQPKIVLPDLELIPHNYEYNISKFDLTLHANEVEEGLHMDFQYSTDLFDYSTIENFVKYFKHITDQIISNVETQISAIDLLKKEGFEKIKRFNDSELSFEVKDDIVKLFEIRVAECPSRTAIVFEGESLSYKELNDRSNQVAAYLVAQKIKKEDVVALLLNRSLDMIIGIFGILKSGAAYLPIEPKLPIERVNYILKSSSAKLLLGHKEYLDNYKAILKVHDIKIPFSEAYSKDNLIIKRSPSDLAYCIYTSGSTGVPKGVLMEHRNIVNLVGGLSRTIYAGLEPGLHVGLLASYSFDASCQQIFGALLEGHSLFISSDEERMDGQELYNFYKENAIEVSDGTPTHFGMFLSSFPGNINLQHLKRWLLAGEYLSKELVRDFYNRLKGDNIPKLYNLYGPTESCVDSTYYSIDHLGLDDYSTIPIGRPLPNERIYIVDGSGHPVPQGIFGELCIAGNGLARGYVDKLNENKKFVANWVPGEERVYRTGDLARWLPDGNLEYRSRMDNQVKLRGYRIELEEIEQVLLSYPTVVESAVVLLTVDDEVCLSAYYISEHNLDTEIVREYLIKTLPEYMVPSFYVRLDSMPLTSNGKLNREALPSPDKLLTKSYIAPSTETEQKLVEIWSEVLNITPQDISVEQSFLELGGHSLKAIQIANKIKKDFSMEIKLAEIFQRTTITKQAKFIDANQWLNEDDQLQEANKQEINI